MRFDYLLGDIRILRTAGTTGSWWLLMFVWWEMASPVYVSPVLRCCAPLSLLTAHCSMRAIWNWPPYRICSHDAAPVDDYKLGHHEPLYYGHVLVARHHTAKNVAIGTLPAHFHRQVFAMVLLDHNGSYRGPGGGGCLYYIFPVRLASRIRVAAGILAWQLRQYNGPLYVGAAM